MIRTHHITLLCLFVWLALISRGSLEVTETTETISLEVMASAYNSLPSQTHEDHPSITAWGDELEPGMKCIAVSRDLLGKGLGHNMEVKISGLAGSFKILDKMNSRYTNAIDIYMGVDKEAALRWGRKKVIISWEVESSIEPGKR